MEENIKAKILFLLRKKGEKIELGIFKREFQDVFKEEYHCPFPKTKCKKLKKCLEKHFAATLTITNQDYVDYVVQTLKNAQEDAQNTLQSVAASPGVSKERAQNYLKNGIPQRPIHPYQPPILNEADFPSLSKTASVKLSVSNMPSINEKRSKFSYNSGPTIASVQEDATHNTVRFINGQNPVFEFPSNGTHSGDLPTEADIDLRVRTIRTNIAKSEAVVEMRDLIEKLCKYYKVASVKDLKCKDRKMNFRKETDIAAVKEFSICQSKVLCLIQAFCTTSTIATLHDLEKLICKEEKKESFKELNLGPLQKFPLVFYHFKYPSDMKIQKCTFESIMKHLWQYGGKMEKGKKMELKKFLKYLCEKEGLDNPYNLGLKINSLPLAISVMRKVKFGDWEKMKKAEIDLAKDMEQDLENYLRKLQKGLTGRNTRALPGQPENVMQKIAGMHIEDAIVSIFKFANDCKQKLRKNVEAGGLFTHANRILDIMMIFNSNPLLSKFFHVILATGLFRSLGMDDMDLLSILGFKSAMKKITDERLQEISPENVPQGPTAKRHRRIQEGRVKEQLTNWLKKSSKALNLSTLVNIERRLSNSLDPQATGFDCLGHGSFLAFLIKHKEFRKYLGTSVMIESTLANQEDHCIVPRKDVENFVFQCGEGKDKSHIVEAIHRQFGKVTQLQKDLIDDIISSQEKDSSNQISRSVTYLHTLTCGVELNEDHPLDEVPPNSNPRTGSFGYLSKDDALNCLKAAPLLENLALWSSWELAFEPCLGDLKRFLNDQDTIQAIEASPNVFLRVNLDSTVDDFKMAIDGDDPEGSAGYLISIICSNGGLNESPIIRLANVVKTSLSAKISVIDKDEDNEEDYKLERFILRCLLRIPVDFCRLIASKIFLAPLTEIFGERQGNDSVPFRLLNACQHADERSYLHRLGAFLAIQEWVEDFKGNRIFCPPHLDQRLPVQSENNTQEGQTTGEEIPKKVAKEELSFASEKDATNSVPEEAVKIQDEEDQPLNETSSSQRSSVNDIEVDGDKGILQTISERMEHCQSIINAIRRDEFGVGEELGEKEAILLQRNNERLCRSLDRLSKELYSKDTHFVLELVQNADDNEYDVQMFSEESIEKPSVAFIVEKEHVTILNNELGFRDENIRALCDVGKSTKGAHRKGYIGQKGIGFKSVFRVTDSPEVHSNGFHICFDASKNSMGYILPEWRSLDEYTDRTEYSPINGDGKINRQLSEVEIKWKTQINLPLKKEVINTKNARARFQDIHPSLLLFLNRLQTIIIDNEVEKKWVIMKKRLRGPNLIELTQNDNITTWFVVTSEVDMRARGQEETTDISLAYPLDDSTTCSLKAKNLPSQHVFAFLPLRSYGFKFLIQADFEVPSSREDIDRDSVWNQSVLQEIPRLMVEAFFKFRDTKSDYIPSDPLYAATRFFQFLPLESEILGVFKPVARKILQLFRKARCIPVVTDEETDDASDVAWMMPSEVIVGNSSLRKIITPAELQRYLNLNYMNPVMQDNVNAALLSALGVHTETLDHLLEIGKSHLKIVSEEPGKLQQTLEWIGKWLLCVSDYLERRFDSSEESLQKIRNATLFPLSNGRIINLTDVAVFFPLEKDKAKISKEVDRHILQLQEDLNILDERLFSGLEEIERLKVTRLLCDLGVKQMTAKDVIDCHIISAFQQKKWKEHLLHSYLVYIKEQYNRDVASVDMEALKGCVVLVTNRGPTMPSESKIYFTPAYGNSIDLKRKYPCVKWTLIDANYLHGRKTNDSKSWEKFLSKLGVIHFPKTRKSTVRIDASSWSEYPWSSLDVAWPKTKDDIYIVEDLVCDEFDQIIDAKNPDQLQSLAEELDKRWKSHFYHIEKKDVAVKDSNGNRLCSTFCSTLIKFKTSYWLPGTASQQSCQSLSQNSMFKPRDLYLRTPDVEAIFRESCSYFAGNLHEPTFINAIGIQVGVQIDALFRKFDEWSGSDDFKTSIEHMMCVYMFIQENLGRIDPAELDKPIIFVPMEQPTDKNATVPGKFCSKAEVCLDEHSKIWTKYSNMFDCQKHLLIQYYPRKILQFFENELKIDSTPTVREYINLACVITDNIRLPDAARIRDLMAVYSVLGDKCILESERGNFDLFIDSESEFEMFYYDMSKYYDPTMAGFVYSNVKDEEIFPTSGGRFVSLKDKPLLADIEKQREIFSECKSIHFLDLPSYLKEWMKEGESAFTKYEKSRGFSPLRTQVKGILIFFSLCKIETLSSVVCPVEITTENSISGCMQWQQEILRLLPYIQRYMIHKKPDLYRSLISEGIVSKLDEMKFYTVSTITALHSIKEKSDDPVVKQKVAAVEFVEPGFCFYIGKNYLDRKDDILEEFLTIFAKNDAELTSKLLDLLLVLSSQNDAANEKHLLRSKISTLPKEEESWKISLPVQEQPRFERCVSSYSEPDRNQEYVETCWPPRDPCTSGNRKSGDKQRTDVSRDSTQWPAPAAPENFPALAQRTERINQGNFDPPPRMSSTVNQFMNDGDMNTKAVPPALPTQSIASFEGKTIRADKQAVAKDDVKELRKKVDPHVTKHAMMPDSEARSSDKTRVVSKYEDEINRENVEATSEAKQEAVSENYADADRIGIRPSVNSQARQLAQGHGTALLMPSYNEQLSRPIEPLRVAYQDVALDAMDEIMHHLILQLSSDDISDESKQTGRIGEMIVYNDLKKKFAATNQKVIWLNEEKESFLPYDILIQQQCSDNENKHNDRFVEVKATTTTTEDKPFEISSQELRFAFEKGQQYDVYRVYGLQKQETVGIKKLNGLATYMDNKTVKVFMIL